MPPIPDGHRGQLGFLFGWLQAKEVPGPLLVKLLQDLGITPQATRTLLSRMQSRGDLSSRKVGRVALYRPAGQFEQQYKQVRRPADEAPWQGFFHTVIYDVPETERTLRDEIRRAAHSHWFGFPRPGIAIGMTSAEPWLDQLRDSTPERSDHLLSCGRLEVELAEARILAERAWRLTERAQDLTAAAEDMRRRAAGDPPTGAAALQTFQHTWHDRSVILLGQPPLPNELLPDDWPLADFRRASIEWSNKQLTPMLHYRDQVLSESPYRDLLVPDPDFEYDDPR